MNKTAYYKKTLCAGKNGKNKYGEKINAYINITIDKKMEGFVLSISGDIYDSETKEFISCGQCIDEIANIFPTEQNKRIEEVWKRWHLNDLHAGCEHQRKFEKEPYENHKDHVCSICNYKYGTEWKFEKIPDEIIKEIVNWK